MKGIYETSMIYRGFRLYFFFEDLIDAMKLKKELDSFNLEVEVKIQRYTLMDKLPPTFADTIKEIIDELNEQADEEVAKALSHLGESGPETLVIKEEKNGED